jgi:hypothetical protein
LANLLPIADCRLPILARSGKNKIGNQQSAIGNNFKR